MLGSKWGVLLVQNKTLVCYRMPKPRWVLEAEKVLKTSRRRGRDVGLCAWRLELTVVKCDAMLYWSLVRLFLMDRLHHTEGSLALTKDLEWLEEICSFDALFPPLFFFFLTFCANFSFKRRVRHSVFLVFPHGSCGLGTYLNIYSRHYVDKTCNPSYHLTHRSQSKTARLCILFLFFCCLANVSGGHFDLPELFGRGGGVCATMHGGSHALAANQRCSAWTKTSFPQKQYYCKIMVDSAIFCWKMDCVFIGQFRDPALRPYLMPLKVEVDSCKIWCNILLIFCEVLPYGHPQIALTLCRN